MGSAQSSVTKQTLEAYTQYMNTVLANEYNKSSMNCTAGNTVSFTTGRDCYFSFTNGTININQQATSDCTLDSSNVNEINSTIQNTVQTATQQFIDNDLQNKQGWFATAFSLQVTGAENSEQVSTLIANQFSGDITNICEGQIGTFNTGIVDLCGAYNGATFNINQDALTTALVSCVNQNVIDAFDTNATLNQLYQETDNVLVSQQEGAGSLLWLWIILGVIFFLIIVAVIVFMIFKNKQSQQQQSPQYIPIPVKSTGTVQRTAPPVTVK